MSAAAASVWACVNAAGKISIDKTASMAEISSGVRALRLVPIPHQTIAPSNTAGNFNADAFCIFATSKAVKLHPMTATPNATDTHRRYTANRELMRARANQTINARVTHAVPPTPGTVQPDTSNSAHRGPHFSSHHTRKAVKGTNTTLMKTPIHTHRQH